MNLKALAQLVRQDMETSDIDTSGDSDIGLLREITTLPCGCQMFSDAQLDDIAKRCASLDDFQIIVAEAQEMLDGEHGLVDQETAELIAAGELFLRNSGPGWAQVTMFQGVK